MRLCGFFLAFALSCPGATLLRIAAGGTGGTDAAGNVWQSDTLYSGGAKWDAINQPELAGQPVPYRSLRYSAPPGASFSYVIPVSPGVYKVTLLWVEPNKTAAGQRLFDVRLNGAVSASGIDLFVLAGGALKPYTRTFDVSVLAGAIQITLTPTTGNAVLSAIQVDQSSFRGQAGQRR